MMYCASLSRSNKNNNVGCKNVKETKGGKRRAKQHDDDRERAGGR